MRDVLIVTGAVVLVPLFMWLLDRWLFPLDHRGEKRKYVLPAWTGPDSPQTAVPVDDPPADDQPATADDIWVAELHTINQLGKFGDLTRPAKDLTHYEVEAVIRQLGVPEWVPERLRVAA